MLKLLLLAAAIALAIFAALVVLVWAQQERIVFQPPRPPSADAADGLVDVRRVDFTGTDGQRLFAYVVEPEDPDSAAGTGGLVVRFHGNAEIAAWGIPWAREVARRTGATVLLPEYRGYAGLPGPPTYAGSGRDALATWRWAVDSLGAAPATTALYGHSLGSAVAAELAAEIRPRVLLLESPFSSARAMAGRFPLPGLSSLWGAIARVHYDTRQRVASFDTPVWVAHGERDFVIPASMGREVHAAARRRGDLLLVPGAGHNDVAMVAGDRYWDWLVRGVNSR